MRIVAVIVLLAFAITLAVVVGTRMSTDALAVIIGIACGVVAGIPMSVLILAALNRRAEAGRYSGGTTPGTPQPTSYPPVVVIQGGTPVPNSLVPPYYPSSLEAAPRRFRIVGEEEQ
jgi:hypothetical protein